MRPYNAHQHHAHLTSKSSSLLAKTRPDASKSNPNGLSSKEFRGRLQERLGPVFNGLRAHDWQLDASEAVHLGLDTLLIAASGEGKSLPFVLPLLDDDEKKSMALIVAPLTPLQIEDYQAKQFESMGLPTLVLKEGNGALNENLHQKFKKRVPRVILVSPEIVFSNASFRNLLSLKEFRENIKVVVFDEAHLIPKWEKHFGVLSRMRPWLPPRVPFLATSATVSAEAEKSIRRNLAFNSARTYVIHRTNDRPNITTSVRKMNKFLDLQALNFIVTDDLDRGLPIRKTMVFVNSNNLTWKVTRHLQKILGSSAFQLVQALDAVRSTSAIQIVLERFKKGEVRVLVVPAVNEAGIGKDVLNIARVVQVQNPDLLETMFQRFGRAARDSKLIGEGILMSEPFLDEDDGGGDDIELMESESDDSIPEPEEDSGSDSIPVPEKDFDSIPEPEEDFDQACFDMGLYQLVDVLRPFYESGKMTIR